VKGNFSWGFINKQEDAESDDDQTQTKVGEQEKKESMTLQSRMTLSGVNLTIKEGSFVCILGKAASGKTTLLKTINGETISVSDKEME